MKRKMPSENERLRRINRNIAAEPSIRKNLGPEGKKVARLASNTAGMPGNEAKPHRKYKVK